MSVNTRVIDGLLTNIDVPVKILNVDTGKDVNYNPGLARSSDGELFISIRACVTNRKSINGITHPLGYENFLYLGKLDEKKLEISGLKEIVPDRDYGWTIWGIEDVRLFWREDGLHGVGVILPLEGGKIKLRQAEILIDYEAGTYSLLKDLGRPFGHAEKNWMPSEHPNPHFDFVYSPTQIVKDGKVIGEPNDLFIHNGTPLIHYKDGYISIAHAVAAVKGERTYAQIALLFDERGKLTHHSQFFHFNVGWREKLQETIEFASGLVWSKGKEGEELLVGLGVKDELLGLAKIPVDKFNWEVYQDTMWYSWQWDSEPNRVELHV